jgi:hypothetical protein
MESELGIMNLCVKHQAYHPIFFECEYCFKEREEATQKYIQKLVELTNSLEQQLSQMREEMERLQAAHQHQYNVAGIMLREAELAGREANQLRKEVDLAYKVCAQICRKLADHCDDPSTWGMASAGSWNSACERAALAIEIFAENRGK